MKKSIEIGSAFVGLIVGAGFASGQEVMQYFTSFGLWGVFGGLVAMALFMFLGYSIAQVGSDLQSASHKDVIYFISGRYVGLVLDILITFFLFGVATVMFAGASSTFEEVFGVSGAIGSIVIVGLTIITLLLNSQKIIQIIAAVTPYLLAIIFVLLIYSIFTMDITWSEANEMAKAQPSAASNWVLGAFLYVSYNLAAGAALLIVMSGGTKDRRIAGMGGLIGGFIAGLLIILIHFGMLAKMDIVAGLDMPTLAIAKQVHPVIGILLAIALLGMMYNTAVGMFYTFTVRLIDPSHKMFKPVVVLIGLLGFLASFIGFTTLVGKAYAAMGYIGFALIIAIIISWIKKEKKSVN